MKKPAWTPSKDEALAGGEGARRKDPAQRLARVKDAPRNFFLEIAHSLMDKNRGRVSTYYCANPACRVTFFDASLGYACPECGAFGIISRYVSDTCTQDPAGRQVVGCIDSIGRLFCSACATQYDLFQDASMLVFSDSLPHARQSCDACRGRLT
ncbi:MAG TPA: hypothetical protein PLS81_05440 [Deltaproteobacteria bacterium]|nr:hypothetical protein [Deltaproteobacteria bacterium]HPP80775.1 hypothetical protein [Deltaproteobacteria bacterium]